MGITQELYQFYAAAPALVVQGPAAAGQGTEGCSDPELGINDPDEVSTYPIYRIINIQWIPCQKTRSDSPTVARINHSASFFQTIR